MQAMEEKEIKEQQLISSEVARRLELELEVRMERKMMMMMMMMDMGMRSYLGSYASHSSSPPLFHSPPSSLGTMNMNVQYHNSQAPALWNSPFHPHPTFAAAHIPEHSVAKSGLHQQTLQATPSSNTIVMNRKTESYEEKAKKWYCSMCQVSATNEGGFNLHLQGKKHLSKLRNSDSTNAVKGSASSVTVPEQERTSVSRKWHCSLCQISATSKALLMTHIEGKNHKSKMAELLGLGKKSHDVVSLDQISQGVDTHGNKDLNDHLQGNIYKADKGIIDLKISDADSNLTDKVSVVGESKMEGGLSMVKNQGIQRKHQEGMAQKVSMDGEIKRKAKLDAEKPSLGAEMRKCAKYWYCEMCDEETSEEETMACHRRSNEHMTLLFQKGGNVIVVSGTPNK